MASDSAESKESLASAPSLECDITELRTISHPTLHYALPFHAPRLPPSIFKYYWQKKGIILYQKDILVECDELEFEGPAKRVRLLHPEEAGTINFWTPLMREGMDPSKDRYFAVANLADENGEAYVLFIAYDVNQNPYSRWGLYPPTAYFFPAHQVKLPPIGRSHMEELTVVDADTDSQTCTLFTGWLNGTFAALRSIVYNFTNYI